MVDSVSRALMDYLSVDTSLIHQDHPRMWVTRASRVCSYNLLSVGPA